jgi:hypothetical protein
MLCALHYANGVKSEGTEERVCKYVCDAVRVDVGKGESMQVRV